VNELTQPCPGCGQPVDLGRRIPICQACWEALDGLPRLAVIDTWQHRHEKKAAYQKALEAAVASLPVRTVTTAGGVL
jgi:hypothetical protein